MEKERFNLLKINANRFYLDKYMDQDSLNQYPFISDKDYDNLVIEWQSENPTKTVKYDLVEWDLDERFEHEPMDPLNKIVFNNDAIRKGIEDYIAKNNITSYYLTYKFDGSSIKAYYDKEGRLRKILGTPDESFGLNRTPSFIRLFPNKVQPGIKSIQGEVLVDASEHGEISRNIANGLTNSKYKKDEVEEKAMIRYYNITFHEGEWSYLRWINAMLTLGTKTLINDRGESRVVFRKAECIDFDKITQTAIAESPEYHDHIQIDGYVLYSEKGVQGFKFYYTETSNVEIKGITWNYQPHNGSYVCKAYFDTVIINDKHISQCSVGSVPNMVSNGWGKGAKVVVTLANMTKPQIIKTNERSNDFQYPTCKCGYQLSEKDIVGSYLKCGNKDCKARYESKIQLIKDWRKSEDLDKNLDAMPFLLIDLLMIDRFNPSKKFKGVDHFDEFYFKIDSKKVINSEMTMKELFDKWFYCSDQQYQNAELNFLAVEKAVRTMFAI